MWNCLIRIELCCVIARGQVGWMMTGMENVLGLMKNKDLLGVRRNARIGERFLLILCAVLLQHYSKAIVSPTPNAFANALTNSFKLAHPRASRLHQPHLNLVESIPIIVLLRIVPVVLRPRPG
jgi:hypothetical protein